MLHDTHGRKVNYLRLSITDHCNLHCMYCRSQDKLLPRKPHDDILRYEELLDLVKLSLDMGVRKVRLTGGEPMLRLDFLRFLESVLSLEQKPDVRMTTNGTLLKGKAALLKDMGLQCVNISLDTLRPAVFWKITGRDLYADVRSAMDECLRTGLRVKINVVGLRGVNEQDLAGFVDLARENPLDVRFIEFMPMAGGALNRNALYWPAPEILEAASRVADLLPVDREGEEKTAGPARMYAIRGGLGRFGVISPMSDHFCGSCNRLRVTSDGRLRTCLFSDREYRLRPALRHPKLGVDTVRRILALANLRKPIGHELLKRKEPEAWITARAMSAIGG